MQDTLITFLKGYYIFFKDKLLIYFMIFIFCKDDSWVKKCKICFFKFISVIPKKERPNKDNILSKIFSRWSPSPSLSYGVGLSYVYINIYIYWQENVLTVSGTWESVCIKLH